MSSVDELCALGFERYWVNQALELTNHNQDYALEWLLSDEFKLAREQFNKQKAKFQSKQTPKGFAMPENHNSSNNNPLLMGHNKEPSLQEIENTYNNKPYHKEQETEIEYNLHEPDLKPKQTLTDYKGIGIDHLLQGSDTDDDSELEKNNNINEDENAKLSHLLHPMDEIEKTSSAQINMDDDVSNNDEDMQNFLQKLKNQVNMKGDWLCHSCGVEVKGDDNECHMCNAIRPGETDWICSTCTFVNAEDEAHCQMCLSEQPNDASLSPKGQLKQEKTWSCPSCQYHNTKTNCCRMCGYELGNEVTPQNGNISEQKQQNGDNSDNEDNVLLELARGDKPKTINVNINNNGNGSKPPLSPSKHISANSRNDVFGDNINGWNKQQNGNNGGMLMVSREKKKRKQSSDDEEEEEEEEEEEDEFEESSIEEVVDNDDDVVVVNQQNKLADANDDDDDGVVAFDDFDIPMMDEDQLKENADVINMVKPSEEIIASAPPMSAPQEAKQEHKQQKKKSELTGMELLKSMYAKDEKKSTKIKLKLRIGTVVDIYSSSRQDWVEGIIKEIKGDLICIVYGKHMKWLKKNSRQLRPKPQQVEQALQKQQSQPQQAVVKVVKNNDVELAYGNDNNNDINNNNGPPAAFEEPDFQPPPPNDPPPAFAMDQNAELMAPMEPDHFATPKPKDNNNNNELNEIMEAKPDEFDYDVTFTTSVLGLELYPDRDGKNCIVGKCLSKTSKKFVDPSSIIVAVNDMWVSGMSYDMVRDAIKQAAKYPPLKIQFRVKMDHIGKKKNAGGINERGYLKVKVVAGVQLKHRASYCVVQVGNARLSTREVQRNEHPEWQEMLTFKNFRPDGGKKAIVTVYDHSTILKDKKIGVTQYELPVQFNKLQRDTLELKSSKGKLSGVVILNTIIVHKSNSIRHLRKY